MIFASEDFETRIAKTESDLVAAQKLRYDVFVKELGGDGDLVDHGLGIERDAFDPFYDHLLLIDRKRATENDAGVVGVYRLLRGDCLDGPGQFYSEAEYDLTALKSSGRRLLELGRSCLHADYRGGPAMMHLWNALGDYVAEHQIEVLFGVASFHGTDLSALAQPLSYLRHRYLAPKELRARGVTAHYSSMDLLPTDQIDRKAAMLDTPALIKAYLRLGGFVGDGAFVDHTFNTTDVFLVMDTDKMTQRHKDRYMRESKT
ncbi:MAG: GNAT family N-acyltransferase [Pseudoruegeria sp.]